MADSSSPSSPDSRLPTTIIPSHYDLSLTPHLDNFSFDGCVAIAIELKKPTETIQVNGDEIKIHKAELVELNGHNSLIPSYVLHNDKDQLISFYFHATIPVGKFILRLKFTGVLNDKLSGFYRTQYKDKQGITRNSATTQFESTDARKAFPCFDEPALKATFTVDITTAKHLTVLSNMPIEKEEAAGEATQLDGSQLPLTKRTFQKTPIMSTYLLCFVIGEYDYLEATTSDGLPIRVYTPLGKAEKGRFALECATRVMPFYNQWFGIPYPLPKLDMIAVEQLAAGAMENWGLVTYRETALLVDHNSSADTRQWVCIVVAHELSHQWFGNIVTMEWWTHLWLNEGFATFMQYFATHFLFPDWGIWKQFVSADFNYALTADALKNSHPVEVECKYAHEVDEIFDAISYEKGATVVRMLESWLGDEAFRTGISAYMKEFQYQNAFSEDLWATLEKTSGKPVKKMMEGWTKVQGFPVVTIEEGKVGDKEVVYKLTQQRFESTGIVSNDTTKWYVPISFIYSGSNGPTGKSTLSEKTGNVTLSFPSADAKKAAKWIKLNGGSTGFYRTLYPFHMWDSLRVAIESRDPDLTPEDRLNLQSDAYAFFYAGLMSADRYLEFVVAYKNETELAIWSDLSRNLSFIYTLTRGNEVSTALLSKYVSDLYSNILASIGYDTRPTDSHQDSMLRLKVISTLANFGDHTVVSTLIEKFIVYYKLVSEKKSLEVGEDILSVDLRDCVFDVVVEHGGLLGYNAVLDLYLTYGEEQQDKERFITALGHAPTIELVSKALDFTLDKDKVSTQDALLLYRAAASGHRALYWSFLQKHWQSFVDRYGGAFGMSSLIAALQGFVSEEKANEIEKFFHGDKHPVPAGERAVKKCLETIRANSHVAEREGNHIHQWLEQRFGVK